MGRILLVGLGLVFVVAFLISRYPDAVVSEDDKLHLVYLVTILTVVSASVLFAKQRPHSISKLKSLAFWAVAILLLVGVYAKRDSILGGNFSGFLSPSTPISVTDRSMTFVKSSDGHFHIEAIIHNQPVRFLVDTGATDIVLSPDAAKRIGFDTNTLSYTQFTKTANGIGKSASVTIDAMHIGKFTLSNMPVSVNSTVMDYSLLGMKFLNKLAGYEVRGDQLTLYFH